MNYVFVADILLFLILLVVGWLLVQSYLLGNGADRSLGRQVEEQRERFEQSLQKIQQSEVNDELKSALTGLSDIAREMKQVIEEIRTSNVEVDEAPEPAVDQDDDQGARPDGDTTSPQRGGAPESPALLVYKPKPGAKPGRCSCHHRALDYGERVLWWPTGGGQVVLFCEKSDQMQMFLRGFDLEEA